MIKRHKYQRTYHLDFSPGVQSDDKIVDSLDSFCGEEVVVSVKMDGENTNMYHDYIHARSIDSPTNFTRNWVTKLHSILKHDIPENIKLVGENLWAEHSIHYPDGFLKGYFYLFAIFEQRGEDIFCISYDKLVEWAELFELPMPEVLYRGEFNINKLKEIANSINTDNIEGFVVRKVKEFHVDDFSKSVVKWVREDHVQDNSEHWLKGAKQNGALNKNVMPPYMGA